MSEHESSDPADQPDDESPDRDQMRLQCIGSFKAHSPDRQVHTIEIWTHFGAMHDRERIRVQPSLLVLTTTDGHGVDWVAQGEYRLTDSPETTLSSDDPLAP
jgi:hypothetical protein